MTSEAGDPERAPLNPDGTGPDGNDPVDGAAGDGETNEPAGDDPIKALVERLDRMERVLREEVARQKQRADRAEAQLRAFGELDERADHLVTEARSEAGRVVEAARAEWDRASKARSEAETVLHDAREEAERITGLARAAAALPAPSAPAGAADRELLEALRDHLIDTRALYAQMTAETRDAVVRLVQAAAQARGRASLRALPFDEERDLQQARR